MSDRAGYDLQLREVIDTDLLICFENQQDRVALHMAAFTAKDPADRAAFEAHWAKIRNDPAVNLRMILADGAVAGHVAVFGPAVEREITYWIGREYWGRGVATRAVREFLRMIPERPVYARAARDNLGSIRVLEKCGFDVLRYDRYFANGRGEEIEEVVWWSVTKRDSIGSVGDTEASESWGLKGQLRGRPISPCRRPLTPALSQRRWRGNTK